MNTHNCRSLAECEEHPRWMVIRAFRVDAPPQFSGRPWWVYRPGTDLNVARFATQPEAVAYATAQAKAETATEPTEEWAHRLENGGATIWPTREQAEADRENYLTRPHDPFEPRPPASAGIWRREVTHWQRVDQ